MKKKSIWISAVIIICLLFWLVVNCFDYGAEKRKKSVQVAVSFSDTKNAMKKPETPPSLPVALPLGTRESRKPEESVCRLEKKTCNVFGSLCARISNRVQKCASPVSNRLIYCGRFSESSFSLAISPVPLQQPSSPNRANSSRIPMMALMPRGI